MSYRNIADKKKNYAKSNQAKKSNVLRDERGTFKWERTGTRHGKKKKYLTSFSDTKARAKKALTSNKAYTLPFKQAFDAATKKDKSRFTWNNKEYLTTKGKREKRFDPTKTKGAATDEQRKLKKRVEWMKIRKEAGKSYSAKNLAKFSSQLKKANVI